MIILAGGEGRRIGGGKPFRLLGGRRLIDRALDQARRWSEWPVIAVRDPAPFADLGVRIIPDDPDAEGPIGGLIGGAAYAAGEGAELLLTIPADTPFLPADLLDRLSQSLAEGHGAVVASSAGRLHPVCGLWRTAALASAKDYIQAGRRSLIGFAEAVGYAGVEWPAEPFDPFFNVNDDEDLDLAERLLAEQG